MQQHALNLQFNCLSNMRNPLNLANFSTPTSTRYRKRRSPKEISASSTWRKSPPSYNSSITSPSPLATSFTAPGSQLHMSTPRNSSPIFSPYTPDRSTNITPMNGKSPRESPGSGGPSPISPKVEHNSSPENMKMSSPEEAGILLPHNYLPASLSSSAYVSSHHLSSAPPPAHPSSRDNGRLTCDECQKTFTSRSNLNKHKRVQHSGEEFTCALCGNKFKNRYYIKEHTSLCAASNQKKAAAAAALESKTSPPPPVGVSFTVASITPVTPPIQLAAHPAPLLPVGLQVGSLQPPEDEQPTDLAIHSRHTNNDNKKNSSHSSPA